MILFKLFITYPQSLVASVRMAERSKAPDSSIAYTTTWTECSGLHLEAWVRIPLLTHFFSLIKSENLMCSLGTNIVSHQRVSERCINLIRFFSATNRPHKNGFRLKCSARWRSSSYLRKDPPLTARLPVFSDFFIFTFFKNRKYCNILGNLGVSHDWFIIFCNRSKWVHLRRGPRGKMSSVARP